MTIHERVRGLGPRDAARPRVLRYSWPAEARFACEAVHWDAPLSHSGEPDQIRLRVTCPDLDEPVVSDAFDFTSAESSAFIKWRRSAACPATAEEHVWEARGYRNGCGICAGCGLFGSDVIDLASVGSLCVACETPTWWSSVKSAPGGLDDEEIDQARLVCRDCSPPDTTDVRDLLTAHARKPQLSGEPAAAPAAVRVGWLRGYVHDESVAQLGSDDATQRRGAVDAVTAGVADARAQLLDDLLAGRVTREQLRALNQDPLSATATH